MENKDAYQASQPQAPDNRKEPYSDSVRIRLEGPDSAHAVPPENVGVAARCEQAVALFDAAFVSEEAAKLNGTEILDRAFNRASKKAYFAVQRDEVAMAILQDAYELALWLIANGETAQRAILGHPILQHRKRLPSLNNIPRLALIVVSQAISDAQLSRCTEDSYVLEYALLHGLTAGDFSMRMAEVPKFNCKQEVQVRRKALKRHAGIAVKSRRKNSASVVIKLSETELEALTAGNNVLCLHVGQDKSEADVGNLVIVYRETLKLES